MSIEVVDVRPHERFAGVYVAKFEDGFKRLATRNLTPGRKVYGKKLKKVVLAVGHVRGGQGRGVEGV